MLPGAYACTTSGEWVLPSMPDCRDHDVGTMSQSIR